MLRQALAWMITAVVVAGTIVTVSGLLAPLIPWLDLLNQFRPWVLACVGLSAVALFGVDRRKTAVCSAGVTTLVAILFLAPLYYAAPHVEGERFLRVATFNLHGRHYDLERTARFFEENDVDVIALQEVQKSGPNPILERLKPGYPHILTCDTCEQALLSRRPWTEAETIDVDRRKPLIVRARFAHDGFAYDVLGTHFAYAFAPEQQATHTRWMIDWFREHPGPAIVAGDFNLTPFSWKLTALSHRGRLVRHGTWLMSWPAGHPTGLVLIDNVLSTADFASGRIFRGPRLGSDHRPVVADIIRQPP